MAKKNEPKFKLGQKVFYLADGYPTWDRVKSIVLRDETIYYILRDLPFKAHDLPLVYCDLKEGGELFSTAQALAKYIEKYDYCTED